MRYLQKSFTVGGTGSDNHDVVFGKRRTLLEGAHLADCSAYECAAGCPMKSSTENASEQRLGRLRAAR